MYLYIFWRILPHSSYHMAHLDCLPVSYIDYTFSTIVKIFLYQRQFICYNLQKESSVMKGAMRVEYTNSLEYAGYAG